MNLSQMAMGGIAFKEVEWWIEMESFQTFLYNIMRYNV
jgi:hypothetical protein